MNCTECNSKNCLTNNPCEIKTSSNINVSRSLYSEDIETSNIYQVTSEIPKNIPRIEEVRLFIEKMKIKRVGVAFCKGLQNEAKEIFEFLNSNNETEFFSVICAYEDINKSLANSEAESSTCKITCNPLGQAGLLNDLNTQINITVGLCVGHDILFSKYSKAPVTNLVVKDRVYKHKPLEFLSK